MLYIGTVITNIFLYLFVLSSAGDGEFLTQLPKVKLLRNNKREGTYCHADIKCLFLNW